MYQLENWFDQKRKINHNSIRYNTAPCVLMGIQFEKVPKKIDGLHTNLVEFQRTTVKALIDIENTKKLNIIINEREMLLQTSAGVLSDSVGSGKTISMLALILLNKLPRVVSDILPLRAIHRGRGIINGYINGCIKRKYKKILRSTIVFAGVSVIEQWAEAIEQFTDLKYYKVTDVRYLRVLLEYIEDNSVDNYDIILIKSGIITSPVIIPFNIPMEIKNEKKTPHIYNIMTNIRNVCWKRIIVDDYDNINLPSNAEVLNGLFTWFISSTRGGGYVGYCYGRNNKEQFSRTEDVLLHNNYKCNQINSNESLFHIFNVRNKSQFIKEYNGLTNPKFYVSKYKNPNDRYVGLLGEIGNEATDEVVQMLNSGSINTAAQTLNIESNNVADIFEKVLGEQYEKYKLSVEVLEFIDTIPENPHTRIPFNQNPDENDTYTKTNLIEKRFPEYNYPNLKGIIKDSEEEFTNIKDCVGKAIQRIKSNIGDGACPICTDSLEDCDPTIIFKCCSMITCDVCGFASLELMKSASNLLGRCPKCRRKISLTSLIAVGCDLDNIVDFKFSEKKETDDSDSEYETESESESESETEEEEEKDRTKLDGIIDIVKGKLPKEAEERKMDINQLQLGSEEYIPPSTTARKVLIFASYDEAIGNISKRLTEENIKYWTLRGTAKNISMTAKEFNRCETTCALVINSTKHSAGLNLQTATDLVFSHVIQDSNVVSQVSGRIQRLGRNCTANIHFMTFDNEARWM